MSILDKVNLIITTTLTTDVAEYISDYFGLDHKEVSSVLKDYLLKRVTTPEKQLTPVFTRPLKPAFTAENTCNFLITRGVKEGKICGTIIRGEGEYCSKHKNH